MNSVVEEGISWTDFTFLDIEFHRMRRSENHVLLSSQA